MKHQGYRDAFESWYSTEVDDPDVELALNENGVYVHDCTRVAYMAWRKGWLHAEPEVERSVLEEYLIMARQPVGVECCGYGDPEQGCCGNAVAVYMTPDEVFGAMGKRHAELCETLAGAMGKSDEQ